jgi:hypothetical protein
MTQRNVPASVMAGLQRPASPDALIWFMQIDHPSLKDPIRVVADVFDYLIDGVLWQKIVFEAQALSDGDGMPTAQLRMPNVDRVIGQALRNANMPARVRGFVYSTADFDLSVDPREPIGTPALIYQFSEMRLVDVQVTPAEITGRLRMHDYSVYPYPGTRATQDRFPGLFL